MKKGNKSVAEMESELFATVKLIIKLHQRFENGSINDRFFQKSSRNAFHDLVKLKMSLRDHGLSLSSLLETMDFRKEYDVAIKILDSITIYETSDKYFGSKLNVSVVDLPKITSDITSTFITLMDALKLDGLKDKGIIFNFFDDLQQNLKKFPGIEVIARKIKDLHDHALKNENILVKNKEYRHKLVDHLYEVFKEFQRHLHG